MKERPILMNGAMVRATLREINPKTQTSRIVNPQPDTSWMHTSDQFGNQHDGRNAKPEELDGLWYWSIPGSSTGNWRCPYGQPGDRLWVRETCRAEEIAYAGYEDGVRYLADNHWHPIDNTREAADAWVELNSYRGQKGAVVPSIHMPRWASRILLEIVSVRVERLQDISEADAWAEGCPRGEPWDNGEGFFPADQQIAEGSWMCWDNARDWYADLWESINGHGSWDANPWVWVIELKRVKP